MHNARFAVLLAGAVAALVSAAAAGPVWGQSYTMTTVAGADRLGSSGKQATTTTTREWRATVAGPAAAHLSVRAAP